MPTYLGSFLYLDEWSNEAAICDDATIQIDWLDDGDILTKLNIDNASMADLGLRHGRLPHRPELADALAQRYPLWLPAESKTRSSNRTALEPLPVINVGEPFISWPEAFHTPPKDFFQPCSTAIVPPRAGGRARPF